MINIPMDKLERPDRANFDRRILIYKLKNGVDNGVKMSNNQIARKLGISCQAVSQLWHKVRFYTLDELETQKNYYEK